MRRCGRCGVEKPLDEFHNQKSHALGKAHTCKVCTRALVKAWSKTARGRAVAKAARRRYRQTEHGRERERARQRRPDQKARAAERRARYRTTIEGRYKEFEQMLRAYYSMTVEEFAHMFNNQGGRCMGCGKLLGFDRRTHVDHSHITGVVRGLLCQGCNIALGGAADRPVVLRALADYLEKA